MAPVLGMTFIEMYRAPRWLRSLARAFKETEYQLEHGIQGAAPW